LNNLSVEAEYEVTKTTETSSLVDEYDSFLKGVKNPSSVGIAENSAEVVISGEVETESKSEGIVGKIVGKIMFWKK